MALGKSIGKISLSLVFLLAVLIAAFPILFALITSLKTLGDIFAYPPPFLFNPTLRNWHNVIVGTDFLAFYKNSLVIGSVTSIAVLVISSLAGYSLARFAIPRKDDIAFWILSQSMMPPVAVILPLYILFSGMRLIDTYPGIIIAYTALNLPLGVWLMRAFFEDLPVELEEAALVDGANRFQTFWKISLPLVRPGLIAVAIYTFIVCLNEFFIAFVLTGTKVRPASVAIAQFLPTGVRGTLYGEAAVAAIFIMTPALLLFFMLQRYFITGLTLGSVKE